MLALPKNGGMVWYAGVFPASNASNFVAAVITLMTRTWLASCLGLRK